MKYISAVSKVVWWMKLLVAAFKKYQENRGDFLSATVGFFGLFSLAPIFYLALFVLSFALRENSAVRSLLLTIANVVPGGSGIAILAFKRSIPATAISVIGLFGFLYGSIGVFQALNYALDNALDIRKERRFYEDVIGFILLTLIVGFLLLVGAIAQTFAVFISHFPLSKGFFSLHPSIGEILAWIITLADIALTIVAVYRIAPSQWLGWRLIWPAWLFSTLAVSLLQAFFFLYLRFADLSAAYGPPATLIASLLWIYYASSVLLLGAEFAAVRKNKDDSLKNQ